MSHLEVISCGLGTSLQDQGRFGYQRYGVGSSGALNQFDLRVVSALVGNEASAAIEFLMLGGVFIYHGEPRLIALSGEAELKVNGVKISPLTAFKVKSQDKITVSTAKSGNSMMLGIEGGFDIKKELGSNSFHLRGGLGTYLKAGDSLPLHKTTGLEASFLTPFKQETGAFNVVLGPQDDYFTQKGLETFLTSDYTISKEADRMGFRLEGAKIEHALGFNIVSDGIATGSIQVPGSGEPIILMADRQTTGGYPKIACVCSFDLPRFSQRRVGETVHFKAITQQEAILKTRHHHKQIQNWLATKQQVKQDLTSEYLLSKNLIDGFI